MTKETLQSQAPIRFKVVPDVVVLEENRAVIPALPSAIAPYEEGFGTLPYLLDRVGAYPSSMFDEVGDIGTYVKPNKNGKYKVTHEGRETLVQSLFSDLETAYEGNYALMEEALRAEKKRTTAFCRTGIISSEEGKRRKAVLSSLEYVSKKTMYTDFIDITTGYDAQRLYFSEILKSAKRIKNVMEKDGAPVDVYTIASTPKAEKHEILSAEELANELALQVAAATPLQALEQGKLTIESKQEAEDIYTTMIGRAGNDYAALSDALKLAYKKLKAGYGGKVNDETRAALAMIRSIRGLAQWDETTRFFREQTGHDTTGMSAAKIRKEVKRMKAELAAAGETPPEAEDTAALETTIIEASEQLDTETKAMLVPDEKNDSLWNRLKHSADNLIHSPKVETAFRYGMAGITLATSAGFAGWLYFQDDTSAHQRQPVTQESFSQEDLDAQAMAAIPHQETAKQIRMAHKASANHAENPVVPAKEKLSGRWEKDDLYQKPAVLPAEDTPDTLTTEVVFTLPKPDSDMAGILAQRAEAVAAITESLASNTLEIVIPVTKFRNGLPNEDGNFQAHVVDAPLVEGEDGTVQLNEEAEALNGAYGIHVFDGYQTDADGTIIAAPGTIIAEGHNKSNLVFNKKDLSVSLGELKVGDEITFITKDGQKIRYVVRYIESVKRAEQTMNDTLAMHTADIDPADLMLAIGCQDVPLPGMDNRESQYAVFAERIPQTQPLIAMAGETQNH